MYKLLLCHRRAPEVSRKEFQSDWRDRRSQLVHALQSSLGFHQYAQIHQVSPLNLLYQGARASRSWLITSPFAALDGQKVPPPWRDTRSAKPGRGWDVVEELAYPSERALAAALTSSSGSDAVHRLAEDQEAKTRLTVPLVLEARVPAQDPAPSFPQIVLLFFLRSWEDVTRTEMLEYWGTSHEELFLSLQDAVGYREYEQMHVRSRPAVSSPIEHVGTPANDPFDGIARMTYADLWAFGRGFLNPATLFANVRLIRDETTFADLQRSRLVLGREYRFEPAETLGQSAPR